MLTPPAPANAQFVGPMLREGGYNPSPVRALANWVKELTQITPQAGLL